MTTSKSHTAIALISAATVAVAFKGIFAKFAYQAGIAVPMLLVLRFGLAFPFLWLGAKVLPDAGQARLTRYDWARCVAPGVLFFAATLCDFTAVSHIEAGLSRIILFTFPLVVILLQALRERRAPAARDLVAFAVTYAGLCLVVAPHGFKALGAQQVQGVFWAVTSAVLYALFLITSQLAMKRMGSSRFTALSNTITLVLVLGYAAAVLPRAAWFVSAPALAWGATIAIACTVIPFFMQNEGVRRIGAKQASLISLFGPGVTVLGAWMLLGERLSGAQWLGFAVVTLGVAYLNGVPKLMGSRRAPQTSGPAGAADGARA